MIIKEAVYKKVKVMQNQCVSPEVHGCDECQEEIRAFSNESDVLEIKIFKKKVQFDAISLHFCSWDCALKRLMKLKTDYFITLPFVNFRAKMSDKTGAHRLKQLLKRIYD